MSHHLVLFDKMGEPVGHARVTNDGVVLSVWINARGFTGLFVPDAAQQTLEVGEE